MKHFAPVASLDMLEHMYYTGHASRYHLLLAHKVLENTKEWMRVFGMMRAWDPNMLVIMDNSLVELGAPLDCKSVAWAAKMVNADVIVLPDKLRCSSTTKEMSIRALKTYREMQHAGELPLQMQFMAVTQGNNSAQVASVAGVLSAMGVGFLGVPRCLEGHEGMTRYRLVKTLQAVAFGMPVHLLGFSDDIETDILTCGTNPNVVGIDSSVPIRAAMEQIHLAHLVQRQAQLGKRPDDYLDYKPTTAHPLLGENLSYIKQVINPYHPTEPI